MTDEVKTDARGDEQPQVDTPAEVSARPVVADTTDVPVEVDHEPVETAGADVPRPLKIVLSLQPHEDRYQALVAVARDGCDPYFRALDLASLALVLDQVPSVVAEAEAHWQTQPLYPRVPTPARPATTPSSRGSTAGSSSSPRARASAGPTAASTTSGPSSADPEPQTGRLSGRTDEPPGEPTAPETEARPAPRRGASPQLPLFS